MADFVGAAVEVGKCIVVPIKRQFDYLCRFNTNTQNLRDEAKKLDDAKVGVQGQVDAARRNIEVIVPQVETWLDNVSKIQENISRIEPEILSVNNGCLAIKSRFSLSRKVVKMVAAVKELQDDAKFGQISHPAPPAALASIPLRGHTSELESRRHIEENIMTTLREKKASMVGIWGMGGVGKTTMAKKIMSKAREEGLFCEIVMAIVSQPVDMLRIQQDMAELLGLRLEVRSLAARAHQLHTRLMSTKSILIILDDLWEELNLEDLGIPDHRDLKEFTILLTSRNKDVFSAMSVEMTSQVKTLSGIEAWSLFKEKVGACADDQYLFPIAEEIVAECKGLPIALVTVGVALKDKKNKSIWEDAVQELRNCNPVPHFLAQVYNPLKLSYDLLESEHVRSIFLLCCLFPEDHNILISDLRLYAWGLGMFEGLRSLHVARNKVQMLVEMLKSRSLLLDGRDGEFTKMHDIIRDVGIFIAAKEGLIDPNLSWKSWAREECKYNVDCTWISLFNARKIKLPKGLSFPNLRFLLINGPKLWKMEELQLCKKFPENVKKLYVLSIRYYILRSLPHTIHLLENLRTLILELCSFLEDMSIVGQLVSLEILSIEECCWIKELPVEIGRLNKLKLLYISKCTNLETIAAGVISRLVRLEELTLMSSFKKWEWGASEGKNARLCELNSLSSLTILRIEIADASLASERIHLPNLVEFNISIGTTSTSTRNHQGSRIYGKEMHVMLNREYIIGDWIHRLLKSTESLLLQGEGSSKLVPLLPELQSLRQLIFKNAKVSRLIDERSSGTTVFPLLEFLWLQGIEDLEEIHGGPISAGSFNNLQVIALSMLPKLHHVPLFCNITTIGIYMCCSLRSLFSCAIQSCLVLEQSSHSRNCITFAKLKELSLNNLSSLNTLCEGIDSIEFPALTKMRIMRCPQLKTLVSSRENDQKKCWNDDSLHLFCKTAQDNVVQHRIQIRYISAFCILASQLDELVIDGYDSISSLWCDHIPTTRLGVLNLKNCGNIKCLFSLSIARNLVNLTVLTIKSCGEMVKVIEYKVDEVKSSPFIKLEVLNLSQLPNLEVFCDWRCALDFPSLRQVDISNCPRMERLSISSDSIENLKCIGIVSCSMLEHVVLWNEEENGQNSRNHPSISFPKLEKMHVRDLPRLTSFCKGIRSIEFPLLTQMKIHKCPNLKSLVSSSENDQNTDNSLRLFIKSEASFGMLEYLTIHGYELISSESSVGLWCEQIPNDFFSRLSVLAVEDCGNIVSLFSPSTAGNLINLKDLTIGNCHEMVKVIEDEEVEGSPFIKLEVLRLEKLPKLKGFCDWRCALQLPLLRLVIIDECPQIERFSFGSLTTPNLEKIRVNSEDISDYDKDLNDALFRGGSLHLDILFGMDESKE